MSLLQGFLVWVAAFVVGAFVGAFWIRHIPSLQSQRRKKDASTRLGLVYLGFPTIVCCAWAIWNNLLAVGIVGLVVLNLGWFIFSSVGSRQEKETSSASRVPAGGALPTPQSGSQSQASLPAVQRAKPTVNTSPQPSPDEQWAADLKGKKDYYGLAAAIADKVNKEKYPYPKAKLATSALTEAGPEAVDAILQLIESRKDCDVDLAMLIVDIGDPRVAAALKPYVLKRAFNWRPSTASVIQAFVCKLDPSFQAELDGLRAAEEAAADAGLTSAEAGIPLREYSTAYIFQPSNRNKTVFDALKTEIASGKSFPLDAPYQIALTHGPAADFIGVLVRLPTKNDEGVALNKRIMRWFSEVGVGEPADSETLNAPLPGKLSRGLRYMSSEYTLLEIIDRLEPTRERGETVGTAQPEPMPRRIAADTESRPAKQVQCVLVIASRPLASEQTLLQQIVAQERAEGHIVPSTCLLASRAGNPNDELFAFAAIRAMGIGGSDLSQRIRVRPFQATDGNQGRYFTVYDTA